SVYLFSDAEPMFEISPDLTKIAYFSDLFEHRGGVFEVFDIFAKESVCPEFDDYERSKRGEQTVTDTATTSFTWLDDEILLVVGAYMHGSATVGGWVYYYDITDGSNKRIIHGDGSRFHVNSIKKDGDNLDLEVALYHDGFNFMGNCVSEQIPISRIRSLIEKGETLTLDFPNIEDIEHECYLTELYGVCTSRVSQE
ncbi:MAG: DUF4652 domain-containing protein, partial [Oscillospiraceae bacterium]|nr:DUF4652 domain-containing protein [Oscillospiraceae bacterium]